MDTLSDFRETALILLFPDGTIKKMLVDNRLLHINYFIDLFKTDSFVKEFASRNGITLPSYLYDSKMMVTYDIDTDFARVGVVIFHNLFIYEIMKNKDYITKSLPLFFITLPKKLTDIQTNIINNICNNNDLSCSLFGMYNDSELEDITYDDFVKLLSPKTK